MRTEALEIIERVTLESGAHEPDGKYCVMELAAFLAGEPWSDRPKCVSSVIGAFLRSWNDNLNRESRQMLKPYALSVLNTAGNDEHEEIRAWMATDWLARQCVPAFLRVAGLTAHAENLESLPALTDTLTAQSAQPHLDAARDAARAAAGAVARAAAGVVARAAAGDAAWDAARAVARDAAWAAAGAAARDAARDAAGAAALDAARDALRPTVTTIQASALSLLDRMIAVHVSE
jgi:hypothetical protein